MLGGGGGVGSAGAGWGLGCGLGEGRVVGCVAARRAASAAARAAAAWRAASWRARDRGLPGCRGASRRGAGSRQPRLLCRRGRSRAGLGSGPETVLALALEGHRGVAQLRQLGGHRLLLVLDARRGCHGCVGLGLRGAAGLLGALLCSQLLRLGLRGLAAHGVRDHRGGRGPLEGPVAGGAHGLEGGGPVEQLLGTLAAEERLEVTEAAALLVDGCGVLAHLGGRRVSLALGRGCPLARSLCRRLLLPELVLGPVERLGRRRRADLDLGEAGVGCGVAGIEGGHPLGRAGGCRLGRVDLVLRGVDRVGVGDGTERRGHQQGATERRRDGQSHRVTSRMCSPHGVPSRLGVAAA